MTSDIKYNGTGIFNIDRFRQYCFEQGTREFSFVSPARCAIAQFLNSESPTTRNRVSSDVYIIDYVDYLLPDAVNSSGRFCFCDSFDQVVAFLDNIDSEDENG
jgi:hypothetical protein